MHDVEIIWVELQFGNDDSNIDNCDSYQNSNIFKNRWKFGGFLKKGEH